MKLAGTEETIYQLTNELLYDEVAYHAMSKASTPYGDGKASQRIVKILKNYLQKEEK